MINNIVEIMKLIDEYSAYLELNGVRLDSNGFPLLEKGTFLGEWPTMVVPYHHRTARFVSDTHKTVLCYYCDDRHIYPRLEHVLDDMPTYRTFMGVIGADITVTADMDAEWQAATMLLNHLFTATLAVQGVKVVANLRCGSEDTLEYLSCIPRGAMCASGFLGCDNTRSELDYSYASKVLAVMPSKLLLYGKRDAIVEQHLDTLGINYRRYPDVRRRYFAESQLKPPR